MRKSVIALLQLVLICHLNGQNCKYEYYFYWSGLAKIDYSSNQLKEANEKFKVAFSKTEFPLAIDLSLALETAEKVRDSTWAQSVSIILAKGGIPFEYFTNFEGYFWHKQFKERFNEYNDYYVRNFDLELRNKFVALRTQDSVFNETYHQWRAGRTELTLKELIDGATAISQGFRNITKEHGFPCEQKMGYYYVHSKISEFSIVPLLAHIYQRGELLYKDKLPNIVCDGKLTPTEQAMLNGFRGYGDSSGVEQEMKIRYDSFRPKR